MSDQNKRSEFYGTIDSISIYEVSLFNLGSMIEYKPRPGTIEGWKYQLRPGEYICDRCGGIIRDDNASLHTRCGKSTLDSHREV